MFIDKHDFYYQIDIVRCVDVFDFPLAKSSVLKRIACNSIVGDRRIEFTKCLWISTSFITKSIL